MMDRLVLPAELRVLVLQRVEAVGALRDDLGDTEIVQRLDVLQRQTLEDVLVARATGRITGAEFVLSEDREVDARLVQQLRRRDRDLLVPVIERSSTTHPVEVLRCDIRIVEELHLEVEFLDPVSAGRLVHPVDVRGVLETDVCLAQLRRKLRLHERQVASHVEDLVDDLEARRAHFVAGTARRARPQLLCGDPLEDKIGRNREIVVDAHRGRDRVGGRLCRDLAQFEHDLPWVERLAGLVRGTHLGAAAADGACIGVEQLLPRELTDPGCADGLDVFGLHQIRNRAHGALRTIPGRERKVHRRREDVAKFGRRKDDEEGHERENVGDPEHLMPTRCSRRGNQIGERVAGERPHLERRLAAV